MRKTKLFSLIMAAALTLTSLPVMMMPVAAEDATLTTGESITIPTDSADGWSSSVSLLVEEYASMKVRYSHGFGSGKKITLTAPAGATGSETYKVVYKVRNPVDTTLTHNASKLLTRIDGATKGTLTITDEWAEYSSNTFKITSGTSTFEAWASSTQPKEAYFDFAGIKIVDTADPSKVIFAWGCYATPSVWTNLTASTHYYVNNKNLVADLTKSGASYTLSDVVLAPGVYQLSGKFSTDAGTADLSVKANDTVMNVGVTTAIEDTVGVTSKELAYTLTLAEEMSLSELSLNWTANGAAKLMFSDLKLKCVELTTASANASIKRGTVVSSAESIANWSTDDAEASVEVDFGNNYVTANVRSGISRGFTKVLLYNPEDAENSLCTPGEKYTVTYYVRLNENAVQNSNFYTFVNTTSGSTSGTPQMSSSKRVLTYDWQEISRSFTQDDRISYLNAYIRGIDLETGANLSASDQSVYTLIDIRGIRMTDADGNNVFAYGIYDETIKPSQWKFPVIMSGNASVTPHTDLSELTLTPSAQGTTFNYDASGKNIALTPGTYTLSGSFAAESGSQNVQLVAYTADGGVVLGETVTVGATKSPVSLDITVESTTTLTGYSIIVDGGAAVYSGEVRIAEKAPEFTKPHGGILMALLLKRRENPTLSFERTNLLTNAIKEVGTSHWTIGDQTLTTGEDEEYGEFLRFSGITTNYTGFVYKDGRILVPGTYEVSGLIRTAVKGQKAIQRITLNGVELGMININNAWQYFVYTVTLTEEGELSFKASGAPGKANIKDYDIANLKLTHREEDPKNPYEISVPMGDSAAIFSDSLLPNIFTEIGSDTWSVNNQTLTLKKDGERYYAVMSDLADDNVGFTYNSGVALAPGKYVLTFDARTEAEGAASTISIFSSGVKLMEENITDQWTAFTVEFLVEEGRTVTLKFSGGGTAEGLVNYSLANVKVTAK